MTRVLAWAVTAWAAWRSWRHRNAPRPIVFDRCEHVTELGLVDAYFDFLMNGRTIILPPASITFERRWV